MDETTIAEIKALAGLAYTPQQVGIALGISQEDIDCFMLDANSGFYQAYWSAWFENDMKLRNSINKLAVAGSSPAQAMMIKIISQNKISMML